MKHALSFFIVALLIPVFANAAETALTVTDVSETSAAVPFTDADQANGNKAINRNGDIFFILKNSHVSDSATVTVTAQKTSKVIPGFGTMTKANNTVSLAAGAEKIVGPFRATAWNDASGYVILSFSGDASASVTVAAMRVPAR